MSSSLINSKGRLVTFPFRYLIHIEYVGSRFNGFQKQKNEKVDDHDHYNTNTRTKNSANVTESERLINKDSVSSSSSSSSSATYDDVVVVVVDDDDDDDDENNNKRNSAKNTNKKNNERTQNVESVQGVIERALGKFLNKMNSGSTMSANDHANVKIFGSSRTDAGVHALHNTAHVDIILPSSSSSSSSTHFHTTTTTTTDNINSDIGTDRNKNVFNHLSLPMTPERLWKGINYHIKELGYFEYVRLIGANFISRPYFHARYDAIERTYKYKIFASAETPSLFDKDTSWHVLLQPTMTTTTIEGEEGHLEKTMKMMTSQIISKKSKRRATALDVVAMNEAGQYFVGVHDFSSFRGKKCNASSPIRSITSVRVVEMNKNENHRRGQIIEITIVAPSFLYHQVRLLVGALKVCGAGDCEIEDVKRILDEKNNDKAPPMAPAKGLFLTNVRYHENFNYRSSSHARRSAIKDDIDENTWQEICSREKE